MRETQKASILNVKENIMSIINTKELTIDTVTPSLKLGEIQKPLTDAERIRRVVLPANHWGTFSASMENTPSQGLTDILTIGLKAIANDRLRDFLSENPLARTVAAADYTISALLAWSADTASSRGSITFTREQVEEWFPSTALHTAMTAKGAQFVDFVKNRLATLAAKNHGLKSEDDANKLITLLAADADQPLAAELIQRLNHIAKGFAAKTAKPALSLDDL
jgi:hypothetical protein